MDTSGHLGTPRDVSVRFQARNGHFRRQEPIPLKPTENRRRDSIATSNEQLKTALVKADLEPEDLAARVRVDAKTVQRWIG